MPAEEKEHIRHMLQVLHLSVHCTCTERQAEMKRSGPSQSFSLPEVDPRGLLGRHQSKNPKKKKKKASFPSESAVMIPSEFSNHDKDASCSFAHG